MSLSLSFSVARRAERNARFTLYIVVGQKVRVAGVPESGREEFANVPSRGEEDNRRDACPEGPPGGTGRSACRAQLIHAQRVEEEVVAEVVVEDASRSAAGRGRAPAELSTADDRAAPINMSSPSAGKRRMDTDVIKLYPWRAESPPPLARRRRRASPILRPISTSCDSRTLVA